VRTGKNAYANGIHIFLQSCIYHHFSRLAKAGINHFHACITQCCSNYFGATVVAIKTDFCYQYSYRAIDCIHIVKKRKNN